MENFRDKPQSAALWRYGLISELLHGSSLGLTLSERLKQAAERTWIHPHQGAIRITGDTLRHWIYRYKKNGLKALDDRPRMDKGKSKISKVIAERLSALRMEYPHTTTETLLTTLLNEKVWNGFRPSRSSLYRLAINHGLKRKPLGAAVVQEAHAFAYESFGQLWVADFLHGPKVRVGQQLKKTYLLTILDDATRYVVFLSLIHI